MRTVRTLALQHKKMTTASPPIINISPIIRHLSTSSSSSFPPNLVQHPDLARCINDVGFACKSWGFFQCTHHGIPDHIIDAFDHECKSFFELPLSVKQPIKRTQDNSRGWFDDELTKQRRDWKECIDIGQPGISKVDGRNQWPDDKAAPMFRPAMEQYYNHCWNLSRALLRACAVGLGMSPNHFDEEAEPHSSYLRLNYYPTCNKKIAPESHGYEEPDPQKDGSLGINKHSDAGCLTVLRQYHDQPSSLQVFQDNAWHRVRPVEGMREFINLCF